MPIGINNITDSGDNPWAAIKRQIADLNRLIREVAASQSLGNSSIEQGSLNLLGGQFIVNGGDVLLLDTTGTVLFRIGAQQFGDRGITAYRADGTVAFRIAKIFSASDSAQRLQFLDSLGKVIGGDAQLSPTGVDFPHVPLVCRPVSRADAQSTSATTWTSLFETRATYSNPAVVFHIAAVCSDATTAGQVQVINTATGSPLAPFFSSPWVGAIPAGTTTETIIASPPLGVPGNANDAYTLQVQVQRTAGTGSISVAIAKAVGGGF